MVIRDWRWVPTCQSANAQNQSLITNHALPNPLARGWLVRRSPSALVGELHRAQPELRGDHAAHRDDGRDRLQHLAPGHPAIVGAADVIGGEVDLSADAERRDD